MKVKHSQKMAATPLLPWVVCEQSGEILAAHCTCMAGYVIIIILHNAANNYFDHDTTLCTALVKLALILLLSYRV